MTALSSRPSTTTPFAHKQPSCFLPFLELNLYNEKEVPDLTFYSPARLFSTHLPLVSLPESVKRRLARSFICVEFPRTHLFHFGTSQTVENLRPQSMGTNSLEEALEKFCWGESVHGPLWNHVLSSWKESLERPEMVFFQQPSHDLRRLAEFVGCPFSPEEEAREVVDNISRLWSFENLSNLDMNKSGNCRKAWSIVHSLGESEVGGWRNDMTADMVEV